MAKLKDIRQSVVVGTFKGADYDTLAIAIALSPITTYRIEAAEQLTADLALPANSTLVLGAGATLSGAYTLTGNNTALFIENKHACISTDLTFAGTWLCDGVSPEQFGAVADGVTDDLIAINKAHALARLTDSKQVIFAGSYKVSDTIIVTNTFSVCRNGMQIIGTNGKTTLKALGSIGTYYNLAENALINSRSIVCNDVAFLASIQVGDIVNIKSNKEFAIGYPQGECQRIEEISGTTITFKDTLHDTYLTSDTARVAKANTVRYSNSGLLKLTMPVNTVDWDTDRRTDGAYFYCVENGDINIEATKHANSGIQLAACYETNVFGRVHHGEMDGLGYGIAINDASMRCKIYGTYIGNRCGVDFGGGVTGVPWDIDVINVTAGVTVDDDGAPFLTHYNTGSVAFINCLALGMGVNETRHAGFTLNAKFNRLINCTTRNLCYGIYSTGTVDMDVDIVGFTGINCRYGLTSTTNAKIKNLRVNGFHIVNDEVENGAAFYMNTGNIEKWHFDNINIVNCIQVFSLPRNINVPNTYPAKLVVNGFSHRCDSGGGVSIYNIQASIEEIILNNVVQENCSSLISTNTAATGLKRIAVNNAVITGSLNVRIIDMALAIDLLRISNAIIKDPAVADTKIAYMAQGLTTLSLIGVHTEGANMKYITDVVTGKTFTNFQPVGCDFVGLTAAHKAQAPANTVGATTSIGL